jgi:hypothetical protein
MADTATAGNAAAATAAAAAASARDLAAKKLLLGNSQTNAILASGVISKMLAKIAEAPHDAKLRLLRLSNTAVKAKLIAVPGAVEFLVDCCGFEHRPSSGGYQGGSGTVGSAGASPGTTLSTALTTVENQNKHAPAAATNKSSGGSRSSSLSSSGRSSSSSTEVLELDEGVDISAARRWVDGVLVAASQRPEGKQLADVTVRLMLPDGSAPVLGFSGEEPLLVLHTLVRYVFWSHFPFTLCTRQPRKNLVGGDLDKTFLELKLGSQVVLVVDPVVRAGQEFKNQSPPSLQQEQKALVRTKWLQSEQHSSSSADHVRASAAAQAKAKALAQAKAKAKEGRERRERALRSFNEDREDVERKSKMEKQKRLAAQARAAEEVDRLRSHQERALGLAQPPAGAAATAAAGAVLAAGGHAARR